MNDITTEKTAGIAAHAAAAAISNDQSTNPKPRRHRRSYSKKVRAASQQGQSKPKKQDPLRSVAKRALEILRMRKDDEFVSPETRSVDKALEERRNTRDPEYRKARAKVEQIKMGLSNWKENVAEDGKVMCSSGLPIEANGEYFAVVAEDVNVKTFPISKTAHHVATDLVDEAMAKSGSRSFARFMEDNPEFGRVRTCHKKGLEKTAAFVEEDASLGILCEEVLEKVILKASDNGQTLDLEGLEEKLVSIETNTRTGKKVLRQLVFGLECPVTDAIGEKKDDGSPFTAIGFLLYGVDPKSDSAEILPVSGKAASLIKRIRRLEEVKAKPNPEVLELLTIHFPFAPKLDNGQNDDRSPILQEFLAICRTEQAAYREEQQQLAAKAQAEAAKANKSSNKKR